MAWTKMQEEAIHKRGENIIVSAGAGSGKTAVLSERILDFCKNGGDIKRVLVLTFTQAAACEMKERIRKKLKENNLETASMEIDSAYITTFDSYSLSIVKKYSYRLGLDGDISIMDGAFEKIKRKEIIREQFTGYYLEKNPFFFRFLDKYSLQDDTQILAMVEEMTDRLALITDTDGFLKSYDREYFSTEKMNEIALAYVDFAKKEVKKFLHAMEELEAEAAMDPISGSLSEFLDTYMAHISLSDSYTDLYDEISSLSLPRISPKASALVKEKKEAVAGLLKNLKENVFKKYRTLEDMTSEILATREDVLFLLSMCKATMDHLMEYKKSLSLFGFSDIAKFAIKLVRDFADVREELRSSYDEILVDEYQDTSDIQEVFLSHIENNNRYMVGDIKQSIYRFRNANPYIFKSKYDAYTKHDGGYKIDLLHNFRSRSEVLDNINFLFNSLMTMEQGDADYRKEHQMVYGQKDYLALTQDKDFNMEILSYLPDMESSFTQAETEAFLVAYDIKKKMSSGIKALHKNGFSSVSYNDFAILISSAGEFLTFKKVFEYLNIPLSVMASLDLKESVLPGLYSSVLTAISKIRERTLDKEFYHAITSICRSFLYQMSDEDIYRLVYLHEDYPVITDLNELAKDSEISYPELFYRITSKFQVYEKLSLIGNVDSSLAVLEHIERSFVLFDDVGYGIKEASLYLKELLSSGIKMEYRPASASRDCVRIMTIHKSKGLEFPYCYFPLLTQHFNKSDMRASVGLSLRYGLFIPFTDYGKSSTIIRTLYQQDVLSADISEKIRLFYVALTRAREQIIFLLPEEEKKEIAEYTSFADMLNARDDLGTYIHSVNLKDYAIEDYSQTKKASFDFKGEQVLSYKEVHLPKTVSQAYISKGIEQIPDQGRIDALKEGTHYHEMLESIDFSNPDMEFLDASPLEKERIKRMMQLPLFEKMKHADVYQEHEFIFEHDKEYCHGIIDLMAVYPDHVVIVDYKLSDTSQSEYKRQLRIYSDYALRVTGKSVSVYLYSILKNELTEIAL